MTAPPSTTRAGQRGRDLRHDAARRVAARGHLAHRRRQAAHRRAARLARRRTTSRAAGRAPTPRTTSSSAGAVRAAARHEHARGVRLDPAGEGQGRLRRHAAPPRQGRHAHGVHRRQVVGLPRDRGARTTLDEGVAMVADSVEFLRGRRPRGVLRRRALLRRLPAQPRVRLRVLEAAAQAAPTRLVLCDTNGGTLPHEVERDRARGRRRTSAPTSVDRRAPPRRRRLRGGQRARRRARRRDAGAGHDQRLRRAHRQLQPHDDHPQPHAEDGRRDDPGRPARAAHAGGPPRRRAGEHGAQPAGALRGDRRRSPTRRGCTSSAIAKRPDAYEHVTPDAVGNGTRFVVSELAGKSTLELKAKELGLELDGPRSTTWSTR